MVTKTKGNVVPMRPRMNAFDFLRERLGSFLGQSHAGKRDLYDAFGYPRTVDTRLLEGMYARNDIANRIISAFPKATWRHAPVIRDERGDSSEEGSTSFSPFVLAIEELFDKLRIMHYLQRGDKLSGIGRFGAIMMGFQDGQKFDTPLEEDRRAPLAYLQPYLETQITINEFETNERDPRYGKPKFYVFQQGGIHGEQFAMSKSIRVHWTRVLHLAEDLDSNDVYGMPRLLPVYNRLMDLEKTVGGGAEGFWLNARPGLAMVADKDAQMDATIMADMKGQVEEFEHQFRRIMALQGVTPTPLSAVVEDPGPIVDRLLDLIAGTVGIPKRILIGSERGELSSEQDENNWAGRIDERRTQYATPMILQPFITRLIQTKNLPTPEGSWWVEWPTNSALNAEAAARIGQIRGATLQGYLSTPGSDLVVPVQEFRTDFLGLPPESEYADELLSSLGPVEPDNDDEVTPDEEVVAEEPVVAVANAAPQTLYVRRDVLNWQDIQEWAKKQGFKTALGEKMHVTIAYSRTPIDWMEIPAAWSLTDGDGEQRDFIVAAGGPRVIEQFNGGAVVLSFNDLELEWRHTAILDCGASWDHPQYQPHITITFEKGDVDLGGIEPYRGEIRLGPEIFEPLKEESSWRDSIVENKRVSKKQKPTKRARGASNGNRDKAGRTNGNKNNKGKARSDKRPRANKTGRRRR